MKYVDDMKVAILAATYHRAEYLRKELGINAFTLSTGNSNGGRGLTMDLVLLDETANITEEVVQTIAPMANKFYQISRVTDLSSLVKDFESE